MLENKLIIFIQIIRNMNDDIKKYEKSKGVTKKDFDSIRRKTNKTFKVN